MHSEDHFSEEGLFGSRFSESSFKFTGKWKVRVPSHASVSKNHANKNYANLWFILLQVTSERFSWKVKTIRGGLYILINKHQQYQCLEFTILKRTWPIFAKTIILKFLTGVQDQNLLEFLKNDYEAKFRQTAFSESVRISHGQHLPPKFFQYLLFLYVWDLNMSRLTCNAILRLVYADFTSSERLSVSRNLLGI